MKTKNTKPRQRPLHPLLKPPSIIAILHYTVSLLLPQLPSPSFLASSSCAFFCAARRLCSRTPSQHAPAIMIAATPHATPTAMTVGVEMVRLGVVSERELGEGGWRRTSRSSSSLVRFVRWSCLRWGPGCVVWNLSLVSCVGLFLLCSSVEMLMLRMCMRQGAAKVYRFSSWPLSASIQFSTARFTPT